MQKTAILIITLIYAGINSYLYTRGLQALPAQPVLRILYTTLFLTFSLSFLVAMMSGEQLPFPFSSVVESIGSYWIMVMVYLVAAAMLGDLLRLADHFLGIFPAYLHQHYPLVKQVYLGITVGVVAMISLWGYVKFDSPEVVHLPLSIPEKGFPGEELRIVAASDIHLGNTIRRSRLEKFVKKINAQKPDIILLAGDVIDRNIRPVEEQRMDEVLSQLKARYGVYAVLGNHEYYGGVDKAMAFLKRSGIHPLRDQSATIDNRFVVVGRDDRTNPDRQSIEQLMLGVNRQLPVILLDHQPYHLSESQQNKIDLQISGHTHRGQIFPFNLLVDRMFELAHGYRKIGHTHFYVSSGLGLWAAPLRIGTQSEIVNVVIRH
ncbi:metallophosphoesterase [Parabacteroides sp. FAFU027]|uniref:metallophosphoesterase n=1 Tax=Parabacteroides sp. FAFU027 TaxID=2922715 RepID=UPI001FAF156A|nr:metallophosphoesterase [Parabacteroides sp. FAFU027]